MNRSLPPLAWFRAFECAARHLNFTAAARELHLTQSAVSQQVRSLEMRLGVPLFQRRPRGLALTDDGRRLLPDVSAAMNTLTRATRAYDVGPTRGLLTVAASVSFNEWFIAPGLHRFLAGEPDIRVRVVSTIWPDDFHTAIADVEVRFGAASLVGEDAERLLPDALIAVAAPHCPCDPDDLAVAPLIETVGTSDGWKSWADYAGYDGALEPSLFVDNYGLAIDLARAGSGIAMASSLLASRCLVDGSLVRVRPEALETNDGYFLATRGKRRSPAGRFAAWLKSEIAELAGAIEQG